MSPDDGLSLCTWNVNSLKVRFEQLKSLLVSQCWDVVCLQETKMTDDRFPYEALRELGYQAFHCGQPTYNGVAVLARLDRFETMALIHDHLPNREDPQQRFLAVRLDTPAVACAYVPNGQTVDSDKYRYKLQWLDNLIAYLKEQRFSEQDFALLGDFNIAPQDCDVHDPALWHEQVLCSSEERRRFAKLLELGFSDAYRVLKPATVQYTWWDYRQLAFQKNRGLRIDHVLLSQSLMQKLNACEIHRQARKAEKASDHAPVSVYIARPKLHQ